MKKRFKDEKMLRLINKALKVGYGELHKPIKGDIVGTPQGSPLSPLLSNIYLDAFDKFILNLTNEFNKGEKRNRNKDYRKLSGMLSRNPSKALDLSLSKKDLMKIPYFDYSDPTFKRMTYVRYVDDWIIGVCGSLDDCIYIKKKCAEFLYTKLKLVLSPEETKITNFSKNILFLGTHIRSNKLQGLANVKGTVYDGSIKAYKKRRGINIILDAPLDRI